MASTIVKLKIKLYGDDEANEGSENRYGKGILNYTFN